MTAYVTVTNLMEIPEITAVKMAMK